MTGSRPITLVSTGIEAAEDLVADISAGLDRALAAVSEVEAITSPA